MPDLSNVNWLAWLLAVLAAFGLGSLWYGPLFGRRWQALAGVTDDDIAGTNMALTYGGAFALQAVAVLALAVVLPPKASALDGALAGLAVGLAWVATAFGVTYLFSNNAGALYAINAGYHVAYYAVAGAILGAF